MTDLSQRLAVQMYMLRRSLREDTAGTLEALRALGARGLELFGPESDFSPAQAALARELGLCVTSRHVEWTELQPDRFDGTVAYLQSVACPIAVVPCLGGEWHVGHSPAEECRDVWLRYIDQLNALCDRLRNYGIRMGYHSHDHEYRTVYGEQSVFELLFGGLQPDVVLELDTGRALLAGMNPADVLRAHGERDLLLHLKPYSRTRGFDTVLSAADDENDLPTLLAAAQREPLWLIVESEANAPDELASVRANCAGLRERLRL